MACVVEPPDCHTSTQSPGVAAGPDRLESEQMSPSPSAQFSLTVRVEIADRPGMLGLVASAIGQAGASIGSIDLVEVREGMLVRDITVDARDSEHWEEIVEGLAALDGVSVLDTTDRTFLMHV